MKRLPAKARIGFKPAVVVALIAALTGCAGSGLNEKAAKRQLTIDEYLLLKDSEKIAYKDIVLRVPQSWGGALLPLDKGPYPTAVDKAIHTGDIGNLMGIYNQSLFELQHPRVKVEYVNFDMCTDNFRSALAVALSAHKAPAYYIARDLPQSIEQGMYADLTPLMQKWDQFKLQPEGSIRQGTVDGKIYTLAANELGATVIRYRKDWFREAGIFNERGEPGPRADWTWDDFRRICAKLTDAKKNRFGYAGEAGSFLYNESNNVPLYVPDPTGKHTWIFNAADPDLTASLQAARELATKDKSVDTSVSMGWFEWHNEFDAGRVAMIQSFSPHIPRESLASPKKMGANAAYRDVVGMATLPRSATGYDPLTPVTNPVGFDPTLKPEELEAAFEWCKSWFYGDMFINRMRNDVLDAKTKHRQSTVYASVLTLPYTPKENLLDKPLDQVFPKDYLDVYKRLKEAHSPPLAREFGLREPPANELNKAVKALYSDAITTDTPLKDLIAKHSALINTTLLNYRGKTDTERMRRYVAALTEFYKQRFPGYYEKVWKQKLATVYRAP